MFSQECFELRLILGKCFENLEGKKCKNCYKLLLL